MELSTSIRLGLSIAGLLGIVSFIRMASKSSRKVFAANTLIYSIGLLSIFASVRLLNLIPVENFRLKYTLFQAIFLLVGIVHVFLCKSKFFKDTKRAFQLGLVYTIAISLVGALLILFVFDFTDDVPVNSILASSILVFPLPFIVFYTFVFFQQMPNPVYNAWYFPMTPEEEPNIQVPPNTETLLLKMIISPGARQLTTKEYIFNAPITLQFGDFFYGSTLESNLKEKTSHIEVIDENGKPYGWMFYIKKPFFWSRNKLIDPDLTILHNNISSNSIIICTRVTDS